MIPSKTRYHVGQNHWRWGALLLGLAWCAPQGFAESPEASRRVVLSHEGSGRATGYAEATKIVTVGEKTHVAWLDANEQGFLVRCRTLDRTTGKWTDTVTIGEAQDNHGGPALTVDSKGFLHVVYYPHHREFRYRRSQRPNDASAWTEEVRFGESLSYPVLLCAPDDSLLLTARRYYEANDRPNEVELWRKPANGSWERQRVLLRSRHLGYAQFGESLAWGPKGEIHLQTRCYETNPKKDGVALQTIGYMRSIDGGISWTRGDGTEISLPATADTIDVIARGGGDTGITLVPGSIAVDSRGVPHLLHSARDERGADTFLVTTDRDGSWSRRSLRRHLPAGFEKHDLAMPGAVSFSDDGGCTIVACAVKLKAGELDWAHPSSEIVRLWSDNGRDFRAEVLGPTDAATPRWLPNLERPTGHNRIPSRPGIIFTDGVAGTGLHDRVLNNRVIWQPAN